ncbi:hypothetical protein [Kitasatospora sp. NPDC085879]|uniref:hypothetical protein n=1 Tax=Kitasatospora sp. NPDC085879 TaxID=3154769 RepID=UPI0011862A1F|nr:hypothetical protein [Streptomyces sp. TLI_235]
MTGAMAAAAGGLAVEFTGSNRCRWPLSMLMNGQCCATDGGDDEEIAAGRLIFGVPGGTVTMS